MRKIIVTSCLLCIFSLYAFSQSPVVHGTCISWQLGITNPTIGGAPTPKSPVEFPSVSIDDHILHFYNIGYDLTLYLFDENNTLVYTYCIQQGSNSLELPKELSGLLEIQLHTNTNYYFYAYITL